MMYFHTFDFVCHGIEPVGHLMIKDLQIQYGIMKMTMISML